LIGAACHSESVTVSHVLTAMKIPVEIAMGTLRLTTGKFTTKEEVLKAVEVIVEAVKRLQNRI
jgi:cysteine desulfurase